MPFREIVYKFLWMPRDQFAGFLDSPNIIWRFFATMEGSQESEEIRVTGVRSYKVMGADRELNTTIVTNEGKFPATLYGRVKDSGNDFALEGKIIYHPPSFGE